MSDSSRELFEFKVSYDMTKNENGMISWQHGNAEVAAYDEDDVLRLFSEEYPGYEIELTKIVKGESLGFFESEEE